MEVVNVTILTEAADDCGAWRSVDVEALVTQLLNQSQQTAGNPLAIAALTSVNHRYGLASVMQKYRDIFLRP